MDRSQKLIKNSVIYTLGNFSSKILSFLLLPIYTIYLNVEDFGVIDLLITSSSLILPVITLQVIDAAYRYMLDSNNENECNVIITNSFLIYLIGYICLILIYIPYTIFFKNKYSLLFLLYIIVIYFFQLILQLCRGMKKNTVYSIAGVLVTFIQGISNIIFIVGLNMKSESLLIAPILGSLIGIIYINKKTNIINKVNFKYIDKCILLKMMKYSVPLCAHSICWWLLTSSGTFLLTYFSNSTKLSGIYAMSNKFPQILAMINSIFFLAWQESAVEEYSSKDRNLYFSKMYNAFLALQITIIFVFLSSINIYFNIFKENEFKEASKYIPILLINNIVSSAISYISIIYNVVKKTGNVIKSSFIGMILTLITNYFLIPKIGIYGLIIGSLIGYTSILIYRVIDTKKYMTINLDFKNLMLRVIILGISIISYYFISGTFQLILFPITLIVFVRLNMQLIKKILISIYSLIKRRSVQ